MHIIPHLAGFGRERIDPPPVNADHHSADRNTVLRSFDPETDIISKNDARLNGE